jgi:hypothetical protein
MKEIEFLGHHIGEGYMRMSPKKVKAILEFPAPTKMKELMSFLGMITWYKRFIPHLCDVAAPLRALLGNDEDKSKVWEVHVDGTEQNKSFNELKLIMTEEPILALPDWEKPFFIQCDASKVGVGAVLCQLGEDGFEHPIAYYSKSHNKAQRKYHSYELETLALVLALKHFKAYIWGAPVYVVTDCRALSFWNTRSTIPDQVARYLSFIQSQGVKFIHRKAELIPVADSLSRDSRWNTLVDWSDDMCNNKRFLPEELENGHESFLLAEKGLLPPIPNQSAGAKNARIMNIHATPIRRAQESDNMCQEIMHFMLHKKWPTTDNKDSGKIRMKWAKVAAMLEIKDGTLMFVNRNNISGQASRVPFIPVSLRPRILKAMHDDPLGGHQGVIATEQRIRARFYWPTITLDVKSHINRCHSCHVNKKLGIKKKTNIRTLPVTPSPWFDIHIDYFTLHDPVELVQGKSKKIAKQVLCLLMVDRFTKEVEIAVANDTKDSTTIAKFKKRILHRKGHVNSVTMDSAFGKLFKDFLDSKCIKHHSTMAHHHESNGLAERQVRSIREFLRHQSKEDISIKELVSQAQWSLNTAVKTATKYTPFQLNHGREARTEIEAELARIEEEIVAPVNNNESGNEIMSEDEVEDIISKAMDDTLEDEKNRLEEIAAMAIPSDKEVVGILAKDEEALSNDQLALVHQDALENIQGHQTRMMDKNGTSGEKFDKGDLVYLDRHAEPVTVLSKSDTQTFGPYQVRGYGYDTDEDTCSMCELSLDKSDTAPPYLVVMNPFVGEDSKFTVHQSDARLWKAELPAKRVLAVNEDIQWSKSSTKMKSALTILAKRYGKTPQEMSYLDIVGEQVLVKWSKSQGSAGWWKGTVIDYEPLLHKHWIQYEVTDENGEDKFPQELIPATQVWKFIK